MPTRIVHLFVLLIQLDFFERARMHKDFDNRSLALIHIFELWVLRNLRFNIGIAATGFAIIQYLVHDFRKRAPAMQSFPHNRRALFKAPRIINATFVGNSRNRLVSHAAPPFLSPTITRITVLAPAKHNNHRND